MKLNFRTININDREWISSILKLSDFRGCEYSFANNFAWRRLADAQISRFGDFYFLRSRIDGEYYYTYPAGQGDIERFIDVLFEETQGENKQLKFISVLEDCAIRLKKIYGDRCEIVEDRDNFDYIYDTQELIELKGKKHHGKRNHIANFKKSDWEYKALTPDLIDDCIEFSTVSFNAKNAYTSHTAVAEQFAINAFFDNYQALRLVGGVLYRDSKLVGFTIGEALNSDTFVIHIEKALPEVQGAYPTLFNEFIKANASQFCYINREDDVGVEGLRKSKLSYKPEFLLKKYVVTINEK